MIVKNIEETRTRYEGNVNELKTSHITITNNKNSGIIQDYGRDYKFIG